jgi:hypothetical protein
MKDELRMNLPSRTLESKLMLVEQPRVVPNGDKQEEESASDKPVIRRYYRNALLDTG